MATQHAEARRLATLQRVGRPRRPRLHAASLQPAGAMIGSRVAPAPMSRTWENSVSYGECRKFPLISAKIFRFTAVLLGWPVKGAAIWRHISYASRIGRPTIWLGLARVLR